MVGEHLTRVTPHIGSAATGVFCGLMKIKFLIPLPAVVLAAALCAPALGLAQSVLLTAGEFALLGGTAITVGGPGPNSIVNGHVGLSPGATSNITGFPPGVVSGITQGGIAAGIIATGGQTAQARADLITAKNALTAMAHIPANDLSNLDIGTLAPLGAGVYFSTSATNQTGALVLNANFLNGVAWVFNFSLSYTTAANATVTFINLGTNGGNDNGVFFNASTAITIGDNNTIVGNYLAGTSISFSGITTTLGGGGTRALALAAVSFAGPGSINPLGGPGGGDFDGGLTYVNGALVPIPPPVIPPAPIVIPPAVIPPGVVVPPAVVPPGATFSGNVLLSSTGLYVPGASGVILVPGTNFPTTTMTLDGSSRNAASPASLTITTATVSLTGTNTYTGGTFVVGGALITGSANLPANGTVSLTNASALVFNQPTAGSFGGVISGNGSVAKAGAGALTISGANTYTGGTTVSAGTLVASTTALPTGQGVVVSSGSTLEFNQTADGSFTGNITGSGTLQKTGAGALTLANTTSTAANVQAGALFFNSGLGTTTVASGAKLGGNGTITGNLVNNGTVSPGFSPGTITVNGNFTQSSTGTLVVELASASSFDKLIISGTASLAGTVQIDTLGGFNPIGNSFTFLTAAGGVTGIFGTVNGSAITSGSAAVATAVTYSSTAVTVSFSQLPFAGFAGTPNQVAVANGAQGNTALTTALDTIPAAGQFPPSLNSMSPQGYQIWTDAAFSRSTALSTRLARNDGVTVGHDNFYFDGSQRRSRARGDRDVRTSHFTSTAELVGGDHAIDANLAVGAFLEHGKTYADLGSLGSSTTVKSDTIGGRAAWNQGTSFAAASFGYSFDKYNSTRPVVIPGTVSVATSNTRGHQWFAGLTAGQHFTTGTVTVSPFGSLLASRWEANGFTESGAGIFNTSVRKQSARSLQSQLGAEAELNWKLNSVVLHPHVRAAWLHEFSNDARAINASFSGSNFAVVTRKPQRDSALVSAGLDFVLGPSALLYTDVTAQSDGRVKMLSSWRVGVAVRF